MTRKNQTRNSKQRSKRPSLLGSLLLELIAVVGFISLMSAAVANRQSSDFAIVSEGNQTHRYGSAIQGYLKDQFQRSGLVSK